MTNMGRRGEWCLVRKRLNERCEKCGRVHKSTSRKGRMTRKDWTLAVLALVGVTLLYLFLSSGNGVYSYCAR